LLLIAQQVVLLATTVAFEMGHIPASYFDE